jgi:cytoskeleton protein RodZ
MGAFGDKLRREREMRGVTLAEMSESTKISKRWLQALEEEQFEVLPGGVFNRGFVRSYARFLGINEEQAVADYVAASNEQQPSENKFPLEVHEKEGTPPLNPKRSFLPILLAVVALVLVVGGWTWWVKHKPQAPAHAQEVSRPGIASQPSSASPDQPAVSATSSSQSGSQTPQQPNATPAAGINKASSSNNQDSFAGQGKSSADTDQNAKQASSETKKDLSKSFTVFIKAKEDSWVSIVADGKTRWEGMLDANMERSVKAGKELVLRTGNAGGLDISYNGKPLGALGKEKQVRTLTFNTAGLQQ